MEKEVLLFRRHEVDHQAWGKRVTVASWILIGALLLIWALSVATPKSERTVYSDLATHAMIASSVWFDGDLKYTSDDLRRFREDFPKVDGPYGLFLKQGASGDLYYAKPYIYGIVAAPFYGLFSVDGFIILNALGLIVIGVVAGLALGRVLGHQWGLFVSVAFVVPTAFLPWVFVPHPDIFIAALLAIGGYFLLRTPASGARHVFGAIILGAALHEKIPFVFVIPFVILAMPVASWAWRGLIGAIVLLSWLLWSLPNIAIDGTLLAYQGLRLYAGGAPYPLEYGWVQPTKGITGHVFDPLLVIASVFRNLGLIGEKLLDFLLGRQTGIIPYFTAGVVLLVARVFFGWNRSLLLLVGLFVYLGMSWLVFPTNGYGGAGSYGSRYLMQALPLIPLSFMGARRTVPARMGRNLSVPLKVGLVIAAIFSSTVQHRIFVSGDELVMRYYSAITDRPLNLFRLERWLLPTIFGGSTTERYRTQDESRHFWIYRVYRTHQHSWGSKFRNPSQAAFVLYRNIDEPFPLIEMVSPVDSGVRIMNEGMIVWSGMLRGGQPKRIEFNENLGFSSAFDLHLGRVVGVSSLVLDVDQLHHYTDGSVRRPMVRFVDEPVRFQDFGLRLSVEEMVARGLELRDGWSHLEPWGVWTDGLQADIALWVGNGGGNFEVELRSHAYVPPRLNELKADFACNGTPANRVVFAASQIETVRLRCELRPEDQYVVVGISIWDPTSPMKEGRGPDPRRLGIGLHTFKLDRLE